MRANKFFLELDTTLHSGNSLTFSNASVDPEILGRDTAVSFATIQHGTSENVNVFINNRTLADGIFSVTYEKSSTSTVTTEPVDILNFSARG